MSITTETETEDFAETITTTASRVHCDGGGGSLGHPRVWLTLGDDGRVQCPYCSRMFVAADGKGNGTGV